ncbi:VWA domain-containing protein [Pseudomonas veronii]|jgi:stress response protein SCP2|uniref:VWA domain-containing protein n=1 Tax=Pseudomonas TaxID=286 RepID=UPI0006418AFF|nr:MULTISPECIES: VWA domain-containing protein [Pseudomonas]KRP87996.1 tellurium resistance protein [Pseudomonas lactis]MDI3187531.1 VWA domain-containing protein [Pseudomonas paracarnis]WLI50396.1 VWA domain-containing protein [Pseudomonas sp. FP833]
MQITQGQRMSLANILPGLSFTLSVNIESPSVVDFVCFGVDDQGKLSDDRYMVFFNQPVTPCSSVKLAAGGQFEINLATLPATIDRLIFTASIDGAGAMSDIRNGNFKVISPVGEIGATCAFSGLTFTTEKAVMIVELYRKNGEWRLTSNLQGFAEGLDALVRHFGGEVTEEAAPAPAPAPSPSTISLDKRVAAVAPELVSLAKKAQVSLEKACLVGMKARVLLVLDVTDSMRNQYKTGRVQEVLNRLVPIAVAMDTDAELECWTFAERPLRLSPVTLTNYQNFVESDNNGWTKWDVGRRYNDEPRAIQKVIESFQASKDKTPMFVVFISDGGVSENRKITQLMVDAAKLGIFWQYVGLAGRNYGILEKLDTMPGRVVDNCGFFALDDLHDMTEEQLYDRLMQEFPMWILEAKREGIIR